ncbi:hypothetical protein HDV01_004257 [Terramyces sp. JEL0728]|nr:hypothetical protein HDV01_004257 [Terramyces sp. JEL0728]
MDTLKSTSVLEEIGKHEKDIQREFNSENEKPQKHRKASIKELSKSLARGHSISNASVPALNQTQGVFSKKNASDLNQQPKQKSPTVAANSKAVFKEREIASQDTVCPFSPRSRANSNKGSRNTIPADPNSPKQPQRLHEEPLLQNNQCRTDQELPSITKKYSYPIDNIENGKNWKPFQKCQELPSDSKVQLPSLSDKSIRKISGGRNASISNDREKSIGEGSITEQNRVKTDNRSPREPPGAEQNPKVSTANNDNPLSLKAKVEAVLEADHLQTSEGKSIRKPRRKSTLESIKDKSIETISLPTRKGYGNELYSSQNDTEATSTTFDPECRSTENGENVYEFPTSQKSISTTRREMRPRKGTLDQTSSARSSIIETQSDRPSETFEISQKQKSKPNSRRSTLKYEVNTLLESHNTILSKYEKFRARKPSLMSTKPTSFKPLTYSAKRNWIYVFNIHNMYRKLGSWYKRISVKNYDRLSENQLKPTDLLTYLLKSQVVIPNQNYISQIKQLLREPQYERSAETVSVLEKLLSFRIQGFAKFQPNQRLFLCQAVKLEEHPKLDMMNSGSIFGDECLVLEDIKRLYTAATTENSIFLRVDKDDFVNYRGRGEDKEFKDWIYQVLSESLFKGYEDPLKVMVNSNFFRIYNFTKNTVIIEQGSQYSEIHFILEGSCKVTRLLPFLKTVQGSKTTYAECDFANIHDRHFANVKVETQELQGEFFPHIPKLFSDQQVLTSQEFTKNLYYDLFNITDPHSPNLYCKHGVVADEDVTIASMRIQDFIQMVPKTLLYQMIIRPSIELYSLKELQEKYLAQVEWREKKLQILESFSK